MIRTGLAACVLAASLFASVAHSESHGDGAMASEEERATMAEALENFGCEPGEIGKQSGDRFEIVGVAADEHEAVRQFTAERGLTWPQIVEPPGRRNLTALFGVRGYPTAFLLDPAGVVIYRSDGYNEGLEAALAEALDS